MKDGAFDRLKASFAALVRSLTAHYDYFAFYPYEVLAQNTDGSLELRTLDARLPGLSRVPVMGLPGVEVKVKKGARVRVGFESGDPARPMASLWNASDLDEIKIVAATKVTVSAPSVVLAQAEGDARPVATVGSLVKVMLVETGIVGAPVEGIGYVTDGVQKVMAG